MSAHQFCKKNVVFQRVTRLLIFGKKFKQDSSPSEEHFLENYVMWGHVDALWRLKISENWYAN